MALVARQKKLARSRADLYRQALDLLCFAWDYSRGLKLPEGSLLSGLEPDDTLVMLRRVAWRMQEGEGLRANAISRSDLKAELRAFFSADWRFGPPRAGSAAREMIGLLRDRTWLLTPRGPALFGFVHRTFLEYLCAFELAERFKAQSLSLDNLRDLYVVPRLGDDSWHEVIRLLVGQLPPTAAGALVQTVCPTEQEVVENGEQLGFAWQCIAEVAPGALRGMVPACRALLDALYIWLAQCLDPTAPGQPEIIEALDALSPGSWPTPCLNECGLPTRSNAFPYTYPQVCAHICQAIWAQEPDSREFLIRTAKTDRDPRRRLASLLALALSFSNSDPKPLLERAVEDPGEEVRRSALGALARIDGDRNSAVLLSQDLDAVAPWLDPATPVDAGWVRSAAEKLGKPETAIRADYERLAERFPLRLA
jgi:hypothetical protein